MPDPRIQDGEGRERIYTGAECGWCRGDGAYLVARFAADGSQYAESKPCRYCGATGSAYPFRREVPNAE